MQPIYVLYEGPSVIDSKPIVALATGVDRLSENPKTGPMVQTWMLRQDLHPQEAVTTGEDYSICGDCPLRKDVCYVIVGQAPSMIWLKYQRGHRVYATDTLTQFGAERVIRIGAYGDPAAIPLSVWSALTQKAQAYVGYTHHWRWCDPNLKHYVMASVESEADADAAQSMGWKTFRVKLEQESIRPNEIMCPASTGSNITCIQCLNCNGQHKNAVINVHGGGISRYKVERFKQLKRWEEEP